MLVTVFRTLIMYVLIIIAFRIMGKRQIGDLQPSELVITILISNIASMPIEETGIPMLGAVVPIFILVSMEVIFSYFSLKCPFFRKVITGTPVVLIQNGEINQHNLKNLRFTVEDLLEELRLKDAHNLYEVELALIETNGQISIYKKEEYQGVVRQDIHLAPEHKKSPYPIILDGKLEERNLESCGKTKGWLTAQLEQEQIEAKNILLMMCDAQGNYQIVKKEYL